METTMQHLTDFSDSAIIQRILDGDKAVYEILIRRNNPVLYKVARSFGFNHQDAEDLMQETYITAFEQLHQFENRSSFKTWITRIMIYKCQYKLNHGFYKREQPRRETITENASPMPGISKKEDSEQAFISREFSKVVEYSLQQLPLHYKTVFILREIEGFNVAETAELLKITTVNVKVRLNRAKALLQQKLEKIYSAADIFEFKAVYCDAMVQCVMQKINVTKEI